MLKKKKKYKTEPENLIRPPWLDKYSDSLIKKLWIPSNHMKEYILPYKLNTQNKYINYECFTDNKSKYTSFEFNDINENNKIGILNQICIIDKNYIKKTIKISPKNSKEINNFIVKFNKLKKKHEKEIKYVSKVLRCEFIQLKLNEKQIILINEWLKASEELYNYCVDYYNKNKGKISTSHIKLRKIIFNDLAKMKNNLLKICPYNILDYEIKVFSENIVSCMTQIKQGTIKNYTLKHKNVKNNQTITIRKQNLHENGFYKKFLGNIKTKNKSFSFSEIVSDCKLVLNKSKNKYYLYCPQYRNKLHIENRKEIVAIDPGEKTFNTFYGLDHCGKIGENIRIPILKYEMKIRQIQRRLNRTKNRKLKEKLLKSLNRNYKKINGLIKEMHNKSILFLCKNYKRIIIPPFKTSYMISNKKEIQIKMKENKQKLNEELKDKTREEVKDKLKIYKRKNRLNCRVKFVLNMQSHYKFKQQLLSKAEEYGCLVTIMGEEYTSQCCGYCGKLSKQYKGRIKNCTYCKKEIERDYNGSRNILIKNISNLLRVNPEIRGMDQSPKKGYE